MLMEGVEYFAGIVGSAFMDLLDLLPDAGIRFINVRDEHTAPHMMDGYGRISGKVGVCIGQNGPGITNMVTSVATANYAHTPMIVLGPSATSQTVGYGGFQEVDQISIFKPITKAAIRVPHPNRAAECIRSAFRIAYTKRGVVYVDIPRDYFYMDVDDEILPPESYRPTKPPSPNPELIKMAAKALIEAESPTIISGKGVVDSNAVREVVKVAEFLSAPVACSYQHIDAFPADHPLWVGPLGYMGSKVAMEVVRDADVILAVGTRLSYFGTLPQYNIKYFTGKQRIIQIELDPEEIGKIHKIEIGIVGDAKISLEALYRELLSTGKSKENRRRLEEVNQMKIDWEKEIKELAMQPGTPINPRRALYEIANSISEDTIVTTDIGNVCATASSYLKFKKARKYIACLTMGNTGFAYQAALGAKLASPEYPVVALVGDGAWGMSFYEVLTALEHKLPVVAVVFNNGCWGAEKRNQIDFYNKRFIAVDIYQPKWADVARVMGANGIRIEKPDEIDSALRDAINSKRPTVLEIMVDGTQLAPPFRRDALSYPRRYLPKYQKQSKN
ncbi:MAG: sulfoacetaldehyde acetyltransferase [Nitrososphaerota archaeon]